MSTSPSDRATDLGMLALAVVWGGNYAVVKAALEVLDPLAFNALRFPLAALVLWVLVRGRPAPPVAPGDGWKLVALGILGNVAYQLCFIFGIDRTLAGNASLLLATAPVWTILLSAALGHERATTGVLVGSVATVAGMLLVVLGQNAALGLGGGTLAGDALMALSAVLWASYTVGSGRMVGRYGSLRLAAWTLWIGTPVLVVMGIPSLLDTEWPRVSPWAWAGVAYAGVFAIAIAYALWNRGIQRLGNARTAVYSNLVPVAALAIAWVALDEVPSPLQLTGAAVILGGISVTRLRRRRVVRS